MIESPWRLMNWSQARSSEPGLHLELIAAIGVNVLESRWRELKDVFIGDVVSGVAELSDDGPYVDGIPCDNGVGQQVQEAR